MMMLPLTLNAASPEWKLVYESDFTRADVPADWRPEGPVKIRCNGKGELEVKNGSVERDGFQSQGSCVWLARPFEGEVRITFNSRADPGSRVILFFDAQPTDPATGLFDWERPLSLYGDYAYETRLRLFSIGLLRSDQASLNLRRLGGEMPETWPRYMPYHPTLFPGRYLTPAEMEVAMKAAGLQVLPTDYRERRAVTLAGEFERLLRPHLTGWEAINRSFQETSIVARAINEEPVFREVERTYRITVESLRERVRIFVDGVCIIDFKRQGEGERPGGYLGFRNFAPTKAYYSELRIYQPRGD
ncbi:MAG TPA: hypothetical protein VNQ90_07830 [Chthoniobacteraceae bacterium]|nr:hypothetical protein [Chthoniobacteraceae bacterium]